MWYFVWRKKIILKPTKHEQMTLTGGMMPEVENQNFQVLSLSGGGFRGLYTAKVLADIEDEINAPIGTRFDLIAGTSVGGILALAIAMEIPAQRIVDLFVNHGSEIFERQWLGFKRRWPFIGGRLSILGLYRSLYSSAPLKRLLSCKDLFGDHLLGECHHPVIIPAINYSSGKPVIFKTPHHPDFKRDHKLKLVDVALATSAAPAYFPRHWLNNNQYVDGGLYANAPGLLGLHEAHFFFKQEISNISLLSIGTMSSKFTVDPRSNREGGTWDWGGLNPVNMPKRLFGLSISVQEWLCDSMLKHQLTTDRYMHIDDDLTDQRSKAVAIDRADDAAREVLLGAASERSKICLGDAQFQKFIANSALAPVFYYGDIATNRNSGDGKSC
jgi:patatin-like phospholipase/acyl hydrolase